MATSHPRQKLVVITGCSEGGLGFALAKAFAAEGCRVLATARSPEKAASLVSHSHNIEVLPLEVTDPESIARCVDEVSRRISASGSGSCGGLDVLVNNAGVGLVMPLLDTPLDQGKKLFDVNVWAMLALTQAFAPLLIKAQGAVLNISSIAGAVRMAWQGVYNASKAAATFLSETLRMELQPLGVRVVTAMVGEVETGFYTHVVASGRGDAFALPAKSYYIPIESFIRKQSRGELQNNEEPADTTAKNLVRDVLQGKAGMVWRGGVAGTARWASWLVPSRLFEWVLHQGRGLYQLNADRPQQPLVPKVFGVES